ncbi:AAA family ATPase [Amycolatopsis sp. cmx-4-54]|uniref:AAA family ATPase n=1 Tax=Amycolatopsis sp. cmx-4-54 TaxID=2790936 RepID=UPI0039782951
MSGYGVGDDMVAKLRKGYRGSSRSTASEVFLDDDGSSRSVPAAPSTAALAARMRSFGPQRRPNGKVYQPRAVAREFEDIALLRDARKYREHVLFFGPPGTGKTALCEAAFAQDATPTHEGMESIVGTADTTESDFVGTFVQDSRTDAWTWRPGPLHRSVLFDVPLLVDEIALIDPRVLSVLYPLMDGRNVLRIPMNPDLDPLPVGKGWFVMAAYNPDVPGARMSDALRDRFEHHIEVMTDWELCVELGVSREIVEIAKNLDTRRRKGELSWSPQMRTLLSYARTERRRGQEFALANLVAKTPQDDRDEVRGALTRKFGAKVRDLRLGRRFAA